MCGGGKNVKQVRKNFLDKIYMCVPSLKFTYFLRPRHASHHPNSKYDYDENFHVQFCHQNCIKYICIRVKHRLNYNQIVKYVSGVNCTLSL